MATVLEEMVRVERDNTGLVWLSNVGKDDVDDTDEQTVFLRVSGILDNSCVAEPAIAIWFQNMTRLLTKDTATVRVRVSILTNDICSFLGHVDQVTSRTVGELDSVDSAFGTNNVCDVADTGTTSGTKVQDLLARANVDVVQTTKNTSSKLGAERVPDTVLGLGGSTLRACARGLY